MDKTRKIVATGSLGLVLVLIGFLGAQHVRTALVAEPTPEVYELEHSEQPLESEAFAGALAGIFLAPRGVQVPEVYMSFDAICGEAGTISFTWDQAGPLALSLELPPEYELQIDSLNTGVFGCGESASVARRHYEYPLPESPYGERATVIVGRSFLKHDEIPPIGGPPRLTEIGGRDAIIFESRPRATDAWSQAARVWFPEPFGLTFIQSSGLPADELLQIAETVAEATETGGAR